MSTLAILSRRFKIILFTVLTLKVLTWFPSVIDDDEAWFGVSGSYLTHLGSFYQMTLDNKPPGTTLFYWLIVQVFGANHVTQIARCLNGLLLFFTAWLIPKIALSLLSRSSELLNKSINKDFISLGAFLFIISFGIGSPKLLSVSNESLMVPLITLAIYLTTSHSNSNSSQKCKYGHSYWRFVFSGVLIGITVYIKQTGIFFLLPLIVSTKSWRKIFSGLLFFGITLFIELSTVGLSDYWYWCFYYPKEYLNSVRNDLFSNWSEISSNILLFSISLFPILLNGVRAIFNDRKIGLASPYKVLYAWLLAAMISILFGKGLFFHYFLLAIPPLVILGVLDLKYFYESPWKLKWILSTYSVTCVLAIFPFFGLFWGNDISYYSRVASRIKTMTQNEDSIFYWGGNPVPVYLAQRPFLKGFVTSRFAAPPYASDQSQSQFKNQFYSSPPMLIIDSHYRGDNRFNLPLKSLPWFMDEIESQYVELIDPALPWTRFYLKKQNMLKWPTSETMNQGLCISSASHTIQSSHFYPNTLKNLQKKLTSFKLSELGQLKNLATWDRFLRASFAAEIFQTSCPNDKMDFEFKYDFQNADDQLSSQVLFLFEKRGFDIPFSMESFSWWMSLAIVEMQPTAFPL